MIPKKKLDDFIKDYLKDNKYIIYHNVFEDTDSSNYIDFESYIFENVSENKSIKEHKFNYYILIEKRYYKLLKNAISIFNDYLYFDLPEIAKFYKPYYNKEDFTYNSIKYVKIKIRIFSNSARSCCKFNIKRSKFENIKLENILIMAIPVKKKYSNMLRLNEPDFDTWNCKKIEDIENMTKIEISDNINFYIDASYFITDRDDGNQTSKNKDKVILNDIIDNFIELLKNHHNVYYDQNKYLKRQYSCILENTKYYSELDVTLSIYFRHTHVKKNE